jgi:hypothetical protein
MKPTNWQDKLSPVAFQYIRRNPAIIALFKAGTEGYSSVEEYAKEFDKHFQPNMLMTEIQANHFELIVKAAGSDKLQDKLDAFSRFKYRRFIPKQAQSTKQILKEARDKISRDEFQQVLAHQTAGVI